MKFLDARRLTGPSLLFDMPGAVLDVSCAPEEADALEPLWRANVARMRDALGWEPCDYARRNLTGGVSVAFTAMIDALYAASAINEWAFAASLAQTAGAPEPDFAAALGGVRDEYAQESNAALLELQAAAAAHGVRFLWDDDYVSLGAGPGARTWPAREPPDPRSLDWSQFDDIPIGLVTGTNGKTTTVRLAKRILTAAGLSAGISSTDWLAVGDRIVDRGDWSGPGGARTILRQNDVDVAVLESARGGLLRRGLGVDRASAALITNIAEDHLGDFGSRTIAELLDIKWIVSRAVRRAGRLILNADDHRLVDKARDFAGELVWFGLDVRSPIIREHLARGGVAFVEDDGELLQLRGDRHVPICNAGDIPITLNGAARHNVANALAAAALTSVLGVSLADIGDGLTTMSQQDNPGRCNVYDVQGKTVLIDFAHNPHAMRALFDMAEALPARRRVLCFGQAGDRPDELIRAMTRDAWAIGLDRVIVSELAAYHRGRQHGDVYSVIRDELLSLGARSDQIAHNEQEVDSFRSALDWADEGDLVIMLALGGAAPIQEQLSSLGASPSVT